MGHDSVSKSASLTGHERHFDDNELIVSKTDLRGRITYANIVFEQISGFNQTELLGQPHSIIRHPHMPRCVFKLLWDMLANGDEVFAYVLNRCKNGDHYWVLAHVTPSFDKTGQITGYHSSRRVPERGVIERAITPLYAKLLREEQKHTNAKQGMAASFQMVVDVLDESHMQYDEFVFSLSRTALAKAG